MSIVRHTNVVNHAEFVRRLEADLPKVAAEIDVDDRGLLHLEMAVLARATVAAIESGDKETMLGHYEFLEVILDSCDSAVENAVVVSYLENVFLGENAPPFSNARADLPANLSKAYDELLQHFESLASVNPDA